MSVLIISSICMSLMILMPSMAQPLSLGLCIMLLSITSCIMVGMFTASWYGYVLFLVYVGGLLVMFAYVSALAPNTFFSGAKSFTLFFCIFLMLMLACSLVLVPDFSDVLVNNSYFNSKMVNSSGVMLVSPSNVSLMVVLGVILLVNLLAVVKVCYYQQGPLRPHFELR